MLEELANLLDINLSADIDIDIINYTKVEEGDTVEKEGRTLHLNLDSLDPEQRRQAWELSHQQMDQDERFLREEEEGETMAMISGYNEDYEETLAYFEPYLDSRYNRVLERAFHLRGYIHARDPSREEIRERKAEIANNNRVPSAMYICSLVSAGYFDPDGGLHNLLWNLEVNEGHQRGDFQDVLEEYVQNQLICVFVENDDDPDDVTNDVIAGLSRYQDHEPIHKWYDIRGIGDGCEEIIDSVVENLQSEFFSLDIDQWRDEDDIWVRIYPTSLPQISL